MKRFKNLLLIALGVFFFTSCATIFTPTKQKITFVGMPETKIYDDGIKLGTITDEGHTTIKVRKKLSDKTLMAKKEGYKNTFFQLDAVFNPVAILNLTDVFGWVIDLATGKCCRWDNDIVEIDMEKAE